MKNINIMGWGNFVFPFLKSFLVAMAPSSIVWLWVDNYCKILQTFFFFPCRVIDFNLSPLPNLCSVHDISTPTTSYVLFCRRKLHFLFLDKAWLFVSVNLTQYTTSYLCRGSTNKIPAGDASWAHDQASHWARKTEATIIHYRQGYLVMM